MSINVDNKTQIVSIDEHQNVCKYEEQNVYFLKNRVKQTRFTSNASKPCVMLIEEI